MRRNIAAVIGAVSLACGSVAVPVVAPEYAPVARAADTSVNWDSVEAPSYNPKIEVTVDETNPTGDFNYLLTFDAVPPRPTSRPGEAGQSNLRNLKVWVIPDDGKTELRRDPEPTDFKWASRQTHPIYDIQHIGKETLILFGEPAGVDGDGNTILEIPDGDYPISAKLPARVSEGSSVPFHAFAGMYAQLRPKVGWQKDFTYLLREPEKDSQFHTYPDACRSENWSKYTLHGDGYGQQLVQLYVGTELPWMALGAEQTNLAADKRQELEQQGFFFGPGYSIRITDPNGNVITEEVMDKASAGDPKQDPRDPYPYSVNQNWLQAWEWNFNATSIADSDQIDESEVWLRSGTTIEFHQLNLIQPDENGECSLGSKDEAQAWANRSLTHIVSYRKDVEREIEDEIQFGSPAGSSG